MDIVPVPEHTVVVEHSVTKACVDVPETILVPLQFVMGLAEQLEEEDDDCCDDVGVGDDVGFCDPFDSSESCDSSGLPEGFVFGGG